MRKFIIGLMLLSSFSVLADDPNIRKEVRIRSFEETSYGALVKIEFDTYCDDLIQPFCIGNADKIKREASCEVEDGFLVAMIKITHQPSRWGNTQNLKRKNVKIKMNGLCQGRTPDRLVVNSQQIF